MKTESKSQAFCEREHIREAAMQFSVPRCRTACLSITHALATRARPSLLDVDGSTTLQHVSPDVCTALTLASK